MSERLLWKSDAFRMLVCASCGRAACHSGTACAVCQHEGRSGGEAIDLLLHYTFKLLMQEMTAMGIDWRAVTSPPV